MDRFNVATGYSTIYNFGLALLLLVACLLLCNLSRCYKPNILQLHRLLGPLPRGGADTPASYSLAWADDTVMPSPELRSEPFERPPISQELRGEPPPLPRRHCPLDIAVAHRHRHGRVNLQLAKLKWQLRNGTFLLISFPPLSSPSAAGNGALLGDTAFMGVRDTHIRFSARTERCGPPLPR